MQINLINGTYSQNIQPKTSLSFGNITARQAKLLKMKVDEAIRRRNTQTFGNILLTLEQRLLNESLNKDAKKFIKSIAANSATFIRNTIISTKELHEALIDSLLSICEFVDISNTCTPIKINEIAQNYFKNGGKNPAIIERIGYIINPAPKKACPRKEHPPLEDVQQETVEKNLKLVYFFLKRKSYSPQDMEDIAQDGNLGLIRAAQLYDSDVGEFSTYAGGWINSFFGRGKEKLQLIPVNQVDMLLVSKVQKARTVLETELGCPPSEEAIAEKLGMPANIVDQALRTEAFLNRRITSITPKENTLPIASTREKAPIENLADKELHEQIISAMDILDPKEKRIVELMYNLKGEGEMSLEDVGQIMKITRERVRQLHDRALKKIYLNRSHRKTLSEFL